MKRDKNFSSPKKGMNRDKAVFDLTNVEYSFALNANFHDEHGSGDINLQNEPSNIYCSGFKEGYKVIGHKFDINNDRTYFFLVNPDTECSEIGYVDIFTNAEELEQVEQECDCKIQVVLENPLEDQVQTETCEYNTIISDCECVDKCLNFSIDHPFYESNIQLKDEIVGRTLYFSDGFNPQRYIQLDNIQQYTQDVEPCTGEVTEECLDCDEMRVFKLFDKPCLKVDKIRGGGNLKAGSYEAIVAYCDSRGNEISSYYSLTNPITIFDKNNRIIDQTDLDYQTNFAIALEVSDLDDNYEYYKVVVIKKDGLDGAVSLHINGIYPIDNKRVIINTLKDKLQDITISDLLVRNTTFNKARGLASGNGYLFQYGLEASREVNLQPIVSLLGSMVKWSTVAANEDLYEDGANVSKFRSYMRDEVTPCSIRFFFDGGYETANFVFVPRPPSVEEIQELGSGYASDSNNQSVLNLPDCLDSDRNKRWQFENTASILGRCSVPAGSSYSEETITKTVTDTCFVSVPDTVSGPDSVPVAGDQDLVTYINNNRDAIIASSDPAWSAIATILTNTYAGDCTPNFGASCGAETLVSETVKALSVGTQTSTTESAPSTDYDEPTPPTLSSCTSTSETEDTTFMSTYMRPWEVVLTRDAYSAISCNASEQMAQLLDPQTQNSKHLGYDGSLGSITSLQTSLTASQVSLSDGYTDKIHSNVRWFKVDFNGLDSVVVQLSTIFANKVDDICTETARVSVFSDCTATTDLSTYSRIISDMTLLADPDKFMVLDSSDFGGTSGTAYIAIDTPIKTDVEFDIQIENPSLDITLIGTSGTADVTIGASTYTVTFNTDLTTTASDFVTTHASDILTNHGITVTSSGAVLTFEDSGDPLDSISIANTSGDLDGTVDFGSFNITINGTDYLVTYNTNLPTTATDFITNHTTSTLLNGVNYDILNSSNNIEVSATGDTLTFRSTEAEYNTLSITNVTATLTGTSSEVERYNVVEATCGCFNIYFRTVIENQVIQFTDLTFTKEQVWQSDCEFVIPKLTKGCDPVPYQYGLFSHWESTDKYPCNDETFNSSELKIKPEDLSLFMSSVEVEEFEDYYVQQTVPGTPDLDSEGNYIWKKDSSGKFLIDFKDRPIRHYKFPCSTKVPFMSYSDGTTDQNPGILKDSLIYPIGFSITPESIKAFLDVAVNNGLISQEERNKIKKYEIYTGDRSVDRSVIAKGFLFDMYQYKDNCPDDELGPNCQDAYYPNYPLNTLGFDLKNGLIPHRFGSASNNLFTFHSPETHFYKPFLPNEMKIEGYQFGYSKNHFDIVRDHSEWVILGPSAYTLAVTLATLEVALEVGTQLADSGILASTGSIGLAGGVALFIALGILLVSSIYKINKIAYEYIKIFEDLGNLQQFAYYSASLGHYNLFKPNSLSTETLRGVVTAKYLEPGRISVPDETSAGATNFRINNLDRESSVFLNLGTYNLNYPDDYKTYDNEDIQEQFSTRGYLYTGKGAADTLSRAACPYVSLKQYLPAQYGSINSVDWKTTGYCGDLNNSSGCDTIFGGDTYISRFAVKRKFPFFTSNAHKLAPRTPFAYSDYFNVNPSSKFNKLYVDYLITDNDDKSFVSLFIWPSLKYPFALNDGVDTLTEKGIFGPFYVKPPFKFYLFSYGFPYFLVESTINCNYRYAKRQEFQDFYPNNQDLIELTQESNVSIREPENFFYNFVYSGIKTKYPTFMLTNDYTREISDKRNDLDNTVIYSRQDSAERDLIDNWLLYKVSDRYDFPKTFGRLIDMDSIESEAILARFENGFTVFGAIDQIRDRFTEETRNIGQGGIFGGRSVNFNKTDLGYAGTQHVAKVSCEFGHFWVDAKRGQVFQLKPNGSGFDEITEGVSKWFKENLPFKILRGVSGIGQLDVDNSYKGLGITMGWDSRLKRVFITKLDYKPKVSGIQYIDGDFFIDVNGTLTEVSLQDDQYFEDCSFTIAYSPLIGMWISYYSFKPNYYIGYNDYFQTGVNYSVDASEVGLWSHLPFLSSYQVFYGKLYPFIIENTVQSKNTNSVLESVEYWLDVRKYYNKYDFADVFGHGFNKAFIYNNYQNSGQLNLVHQKNNDLRQSLDYPKHNSESIDILQSEINGKWSFNYFYNLIRSERSGLPVWINDCSQVNKELDNRLLDYRSTYKDRLRGDYFLVRLQQDEESRFKMIYRFQTDVRNFYNQ